MFTMSIHQDGNAFIALVGQDIASGIAGSGDTPREAIQNLLDSNPEFGKEVAV